MTELDDISPIFPKPDSPSFVFDPQTHGLVATPLLQSSCKYQTSSDSPDDWTKLDSNTGLVLDDCLATADHDGYIVPPNVPSSSCGDLYIPESFSDQHGTTTSHNLYVTELANQQHDHQTYPLPCQSDTNVAKKVKSVLISRQKQQQQLSGDELCTCSCSCAERKHSQCSYINNSSQCGHSDERTCCSSGKHEKTSFNSVLKFPPCFVCGGTASWLHYGVNTCEPCKGFFVRYLRKQEEYKCEKNIDCPVTHRLGRNCSACRLKKCLALGMSRIRSRLGRYSLSRRMDTVMQVNKLEKDSIRWQDVQQHPVFNTSAILQNNATKREVTDKQAKTVESATKETPSQFKLSTNMATPCLSHELVTFLVDYMNKIHTYGEELITQEQINDKLKSRYEAYQLKIGLFGNLKTIPKDEYFNLLKGYGIEIDKRMVFLKQSANEMMNVIERHCNFTKQIHNFTNLSGRDQPNLLKSSRYDFFMILMQNDYMHEEHVFLAHNGVAFHREEVAAKFFSRKLVISVCDMYHRLQRLKLSPEQNALLIAISLVFTDRCSLENPQAVEQIQLSLTRVLQTQLQRSNTSSASLRFTKIIDCLIMMRHSSELYLKEYNKLCRDEMVIEEVPIMAEVLFEDK